MRLPRLATASVVASSLLLAGLTGCTSDSGGPGGGENEDRGEWHEQDESQLGADPCVPKSGEDTTARHLGRRTGAHDFSSVPSPCLFARQRLQPGDFIRDCRCLGSLDASGNKLVVR